VLTAQDHLLAGRVRRCADHVDADRQDGERLTVTDRCCGDDEGEGRNSVRCQARAQRGPRHHGHRLLPSGGGPLGHGCPAVQAVVPDEGARDGCADRDRADVANGSGDGDRSLGDRDLRADTRQSHGRWTGHGRSGHKNLSGHKNVSRREIGHPAGCHGGRPGCDCRRHGGGEQGSAGRQSAYSLPALGHRHVTPARRSHATWAIRCSLVNVRCSWTSGSGNHATSMASASGSPSMLSSPPVASSR